MASLVSYDNSDDDSSESDVEAQVSNDVEISKHDSKPETSKQSNDFKKELDVINEQENINENVSDFSLFKSLPVPKTRTDDAYLDEEEEVEDEFLDIRTISSKNYFDTETGNSKDQPHASRERSTLILPSVKGNKITEGENKMTALNNKKLEKSVKIHVPPLSAYESEDEAEEPSKKKIKPNEGKSGLFATLPSPKNVPVKSTTRSLIPHSVSRPQNQKGKNLPSKSASTEKKLGKPVHNSLSSNNMNENDSDDDNETMNFFSLNDTEPQLPSVFTEPTVADDQYSWGSNPTFNSTVDENINLDIGPVAGPAVNENYPIQETEEEYENQEADPNTLEIDDEILLRLQGKRRHKQEEINFIDVSQGDQLSQNAEWLMKDLTEEKVSRAHRLKTHLPTAQQRRKHQITYLAFQAKERELELKNQWAQNRLTKRQTQSKYGF